jgi:5-methylcytosine-specific restriction endonuclease McrA
MTTYKVIATITWKFDSPHSHGQSLEYAKQQLDKILEANPKGHDFDGFTVQVDLAKMKDRKRLIHLGVFELDEVFPFVTVEDTKREYTVADKTHLVRMNSDRYHVFKKNKNCVSCGLAGSKMILDMNPGDTSPHFNMYAEEHGRFVLMTKDHIHAKSKGGTDNLENFQTMCSTCNNLKGAYNLTLDQCRELRRLFDNGDKLPRKEMRDLINTTRERMAELNSSKEDHDQGHSTEDSGGGTEAPLEERGTAA